MKKGGKFEKKPLSSGFTENKTYYLSPLLTDKMCFDVVTKTLPRKKNTSPHLTLLGEFK